jgi:hypothetical protein
MTQNLTTLKNTLDALPKIAAAQTTSTNLLVDGACRLRGIWIRSTGTEGTVSLLDGAGGSEILLINTPAVEHGFYIPLPDHGLEFATGIYATLADVDGITAFYS